MCINRALRGSFEIGEFPVTPPAFSFLIARLTVGEVMTKDPITVGPGRSARDAARVMLERKIGALPVTEHGRVVGILTETDCLRAFAGVSGRATGAA